MRIKTAGAGRWAALSWLLPAALMAQEPQALETVTVTATPLPEQTFEIPASIYTLAGDDLHGDDLGVSIAESLQALPGVLARDRQNYAQDTQISIRGFGSRASFGIRGLRLYVDGIPATQPDGQGQVSHFNLATAQRVEVLSGPFSALYGNSSGGVIALFSGDGTERPEVTLESAAGSYGRWRSNGGVTGSWGRSDFNLGYTHFETDGFRDHSAARRESVNAKINFSVGAQGHLTLVLNGFDTEADDPLGLSREEFDQDPSQATAVAEQFNTRKSADQIQAGMIYEHAFDGGHQLRAMTYYGERRVRQFLAIPSFPQTFPTHSGGVIDLHTPYGGSDLRWSWDGALVSRPLTLVAGLSWDGLSQHRRGYENFVGEQLGVLGALRRDEDDDVSGFDQYAQANWHFLPRWSAMAGLRHSRVAFESDDHYITADNGDDSGRTDYSEFVPVGGLMFRYRPALNFYGAYGRGFETPTFAELAYRPDGSGGLNMDLEAATSRNAELGAKWQLSRGRRAQLALFQSDTRNELIVATNSGGRTTYTNASESRRRGAEAALDWRMAPQWRLQLAYTWVEAELRKDYQVCAGTPCTEAATVVPAGSRIAGVPESSLFAGLRWGRDLGWYAQAQAQYLDSVPVDDLDTESAPSYALFDLTLGYGLPLTQGRLQAYLRCDNLLDQDYVGSVIVNERNGRYYEPGPGRAVLAGVSYRWAR